MSDLEQYKAALARHDWSYEYSDHYGTWVKGREERYALRGMAQRLDPDYSIWNSLAPEEYRFKQVA